MPITGKSAGSMRGKICTACGWDEAANSDCERCRLILRVLDAEQTSRLSIQGLTFEELRVANLKRCTESFHGQLSDWTPLEWAGAMAGEAGEACNAAKKLRRGEDVPCEAIADEIADTVIYGCLLCQALGVRLEDHIIRKFNAISNRYDSTVKLTSSKKD